MLRMERLPIVETLEVHLITYNFDLITRTKTLCWSNTLKEIAPAGFHSNKFFAFIRRLTDMSIQINLARLIKFSVDKTLYICRGWQFF